MNDKQIETIKKSLIIKDGQVFATSREVAMAFGKKHKHVLRGIEALEVPEEWAGSNFGPGSYPDAQGQMRPMVEMTRKGFTLLAMGFTGKAAMRFKIAYIEAFDQMEKALQTKQAMPGRPEQVVLVVGDFAERDRPVAVSTPYGTAYVNTATWLLHFFANARPGGNESRKLMSAQLACNGFSKVMPPALQLNFKLKAALLKANPLWSDIMHCQRLGLTNRAIARICGCAPSTLRRQLKKMQQAGLFDDPLAAMRGSTMLITEEGAEVQP